MILGGSSTAATAKSAIIVLTTAGFIPEHSRVGNGFVWVRIDGCKLLYNIKKQ